MNEKKVCFIWNSAENEYLNKSMACIDELEYDEDYTIEKIVVNDISIARGNNEAMHKSDAKYKIYINERNFINNKKFIIDILEIFKDSNVGMIGIMGSKSIPTGGIWYQSKNKVGKLAVNNNVKEIIESYNDYSDVYEEVKVIDGSIIITQYDMEWKDDIFKGKYFYDSAQCIEFTKKGYKIVVPKQEQPWCLFNPQNTDFIEFNKDKEKFLEHYSKDIFPLVSILIPSYNRPEYLKIALESAINQTYKNIEIIVGDDSTNEEVRKMMKSYLEKYKSIKYIYNGGQLGEFGLKNLKNILDISKGKFINVLMDDDIFHPEKIKKMMNYYIENDGITLVTSHRQLINENGRFLPDRNATRRFLEKDTILNGKELGKYLLRSFLNVIGEPTSVLLRKDDIDTMYGNYMGRNYKCLIDISQWLELLRKGDAVYISQSLSYFREHESQNQNKPYLRLQGAIDSFNYINDSYKYNNFIDAEYEYLEILNTWLNANNHYKDEVEILKKDENFNFNEFKTFLQCLEDAKLIIDCNYKFECILCGNKVMRFLPYEIQDTEYIKRFHIIGSDIENFSCPYCYCNDRLRHLMMYFDKLNIWKDQIIGKKILHIAPENYLQQIILQLKPKEYICGDLMPNSENNIIKIDITDINYPNEYFDFIICNHVLEHVTNDGFAMKELYRVLKFDGKAILQTPYSQEIQKSFEDLNIKSDIERQKYYGQKDHVRIYGKDLFTRLENAGFKLEVIKNSDLFSNEECKYYGVNYKEDLIMVNK